MINKTKKQIDNLSYQIIGAAIEVHKVIRGLLESVYQKCLEKELEIIELKFKTELAIPLNYKNHDLNVELRCDLFVEENIVVELKSCAEILPVHEAQLLTYMKLLSAPKGIIINFNSSNIFHEGQKTFVNEFYRILK